MQVEAENAEKLRWWENWLFCVGFCVGLALGRTAKCANDFWMYLKFRLFGVIDFKPTEAQEGEVSAPAEE